MYVVRVYLGSYIVEKSAVYRTWCHYFFSSLGVGSMGAGSFGGAPLESFTQERALAVATKGQILLTFTNRIRLDFADTWVYHVKALKMTNYLVGATDAEVPSLDF